MYNNFSSKKTKKVISALLASALVVTSAPITADAATTKVLGVKKTFTVKKTTKVSGLSKAEKKIVKVSVNKKKRKVTVKGVKPGKATFKIGSKTYNVKVGSTSVAVKAGKKTMTVGQYTNVKATGKNGAKDTIVFTSSNSKVVAVNSAKKATKTANSKGVASVKATAKKAGTVTITAASKYTGKKVKIKLTVKAATTTTATPEVTATATATGNAATATPEVTATATATATATTNPTATGNAATATPEVPSGSATTAPTEVPTGSATTAPTVDPGVTAVPTATTTPTQAPEVVSASVVSVAAVNTQDEAISLDAVTKNGTIKVTFSEVVKSDSINNSNFKITDANGKNISIPASDVKLAPGGTTATVDLKNMGLDKKATYTLTVDGVKTSKNDTVVSKKVSFTVANVSIVQAIILDVKSDTDELDTNMKSYNGVVAQNGHPGDKQTIIVKYDELLDASTVNAANIALVNTATNERIPVTYETDTNSGTITIKSRTDLLSKTLYQLQISGIKTAINGEAESMNHIFTVEGVEPLSGGASYRTLDSKAVGDVTAADGSIYNVKVWPKVAAGLKEKGLDDTEYYAGLQINVTVQENLDAASVKENVILVVKETKEIVDTTINYQSDAKIITIVPNADLKENTEYEIQYLGGLKTTDNVYLNGSKKSDVVSNQSKAFTTLDATAPVIEDIVSKTTGSFEPNKEHEFTVTFSEAVDLTENNVLIAESSVDPEISDSTDGVLAPTTDYEVLPVAGSDSKQYTIKIKTGKLTENKAYKLRVIGKDMKNYAAVKNRTNKGVVADGATPYVNYLATSSLVSFSTELDTVAPKLVNVYDGGKLDTDKILTTTKTNVTSTGNNNVFTFEFDEELALTGPNNDVFDTTNVSLEVNNNGVWTRDNGAIITATPIANKDSKKVAVKIVVNTTFKDAKYRLVFAKGAIKDLVASPNTNITDEFKYEFVGTAGDDTAASVNVRAGVAVNGSDSVTYEVTDTDTLAGNQIDIKSRFFFVLDENETTGITAANISVKDADGNVVEGEIKEVTNYAGTDFTTPNTVYAFIPTKDLAHGTKYNVTLTGVKDIVGNAVETKAVTFKTAKDANKVTSVSIEDGANGVNRTPKITITLNNKDVDLMKGTNLTLVAGTNPYTDYNLSANDDKNEYTITFTGDQKLAANTQYTLTITPSAGNVKTVKFTTGMDGVDVVKPELDKTTYPSGVAVDNNFVYTDSTINTVAGANGTMVVTLDYNEKLNKDDVSAVIQNLSDKDKVATVVATSLDTAKKKLTITVAGLEDGTTYSVAITGIKDEAKNEADKVTFYIATDKTGGVTASAEARDAVADYEATINALDLTDANDLATAQTNISSATGGKGATAKTKVDSVANVAEKNALTAKIDAIDTKIKDAQKAADDITIATSIKNYETALKLYDAEGNSTDAGTHESALSYTDSNATAIGLTFSMSGLGISTTSTETGVFSVAYGCGTGTTITKYYKVTSTGVNNFTVTRATASEAADAEIAAEVSAFETAFKVGAGLQSSAISSHTVGNGVSLSVTEVKDESTVLTVDANGLSTTDTADDAFFKAEFAKTNGTTVTKYYKVTSTGTANTFTVVASTAEEAGVTE